MLAALPRSSQQPNLHSLHAQIVKGVHLHYLVTDNIQRVHNVSTVEKLIQFKEDVYIRWYFKLFIW